MNEIKQIINNADLKIDQKYVYISDNRTEPIIVQHIEAGFQNEDHKRNYMESTGGCYMLKDLESDNIFDLHRVDYLDARYKIYPIDKENIGFILDLFKFRNSRKNQNLLLKHYRIINNLK